MLPSDDPAVYALIGKQPGSAIWFPDDFYGKEFLDIVPDIIHWDDISGLTEVFNANRTFTGLAAGIEIELLITVSDFMASDNTNGCIDVYKNNERLGAAVEMHTGVLQDNEMRISVKNGDRLKFYALSVTTNGNIAPGAHMKVQVRNASLYDQVVNEFQVHIGPSPHNISV